MTRVLEISNSEQPGSEKRIIVMALATSGAAKPQELANIEPGRSYIATVHEGQIVLIADRSLEQFKGFGPPKDAGDDEAKRPEGKDALAPEEIDLILALRDIGVTVGIDTIQLLRERASPSDGSEQLAAALIAGGRGDLDWSEMGEQDRERLKNGMAAEGLALMPMKDLEDYARLAKKERQQTEQDLHTTEQRRLADVQATTGTDQNEKLPVVPQGAKDATDPGPTEGAGTTAKLELPSDLDRMTKAELQAFADKHKIELSADATKAVMLTTIKTTAAA